MYQNLEEDVIESIEEFGVDDCVDISIDDPNVFFLANDLLVHNCGRKVAIITDTELGDSYGKIRPADWVISLNQTQEEYDKGMMRVYVVKARDSKQHYLVTCHVNYGNLRMEEPSAEEIENVQSQA
jgi:hypothetical protein